MKAIENLRRKLESIGATLDEGDGYTLNCDAPSGYVWSANHCCAIAIHCANNSQTWYAKAINEDGLPRLAMGLEKITDEEEIAAKRFELDDETWGAPESAPDRIDFPR